jgi:hypothetical protein
MPSSKFVSPVNGQNLQPNTAFDIKMAVNNLVTGNFVNAQENYYSAPQQVNAQGNIVGHTHFTVQAVPSFTSTTPLDPNVFAFFKGVNGAAQGGVVTESVANGLPAGSYRVCSINTDANHTPCLVAVAQHGSLDDCVYVSSDNSMYLEFRLIHVCSSLSVVPLVTILSRPALELRTGLPLEMVQEPATMPLVLPMPQRLPLLLPRLGKEKAQRLPLLQPVRVPPRVERAQRLPLLQPVRVLPQVEKAQRLPLLQPVRVLPRMEKVQLQGRAVPKGVAVVDMVRVTVDLSLGVTTELRDVTLRLRSAHSCLG